MREAWPRQPLAAMFARVYMPGRWVGPSAAASCRGEHCSALALPLRPSRRRLRLAGWYFSVWGMLLLLLGLLPYYHSFRLLGSTGVGRVAQRRGGECRLKRGMRAACMCVMTASLCQCPCSAGAIRHLSWCPWHSSLIPPLKWCSPHALPLPLPLAHPQAPCAAATLRLVRWWCGACSCTASGGWAATCRACRRSVMLAWGRAGGG